MMDHNRRNLILSAGIAGTALGLMPMTKLLAKDNTARKPLKILFLGGTGFIGPHMVRQVIFRVTSMSKTWLSLPLSR